MANQYYTEEELDLLALNAVIIHQNKSNNALPPLNIELINDNALDDANDLPPHPLLIRQNNTVDVVDEDGDVIMAY